MSRIGLRPRNRALVIPRDARSAAFVTPRGQGGLLGLLGPEGRFAFAPLLAHSSTALQARREMARTRAFRALVEWVHADWRGAGLETDEKDGEVGRRAASFTIDALTIRIDQRQNEAASLQNAFSFTFSATASGVRLLKNSALAFEL